MPQHHRRRLTRFQASESLRALERLRVAVDEASQTLAGQRLSENDIADDVELIARHAKAIPLFGLIGGGVVTGLAVLVGQPSLALTASVAAGAVITAYPAVDAVAYRIAKTKERSTASRRTHWSLDSRARLHWSLGSRARRPPSAEAVIAVFKEVDGHVRSQELVFQNRTLEFMAQPAIRRYLQRNEIDPDSDRTELLKLGVALAERLVATKGKIAEATQHVDADGIDVIVAAGKVSSLSPPPPAEDRSVYRVSADVRDALGEQAVLADKILDAFERYPQSVKSERKSLRQSRLRHLPLIVAGIGAVLLAVASGNPMVGGAGLATLVEVSGVAVAGVGIARHSYLYVRTPEREDALHHRDGELLAARRVTNLQTLHELRHEVAANELKVTRCVQRFLEQPHVAHHLALSQPLDANSPDLQRWVERTANRILFGDSLPAALEGSLPALSELKERPVSPLDFRPLREYMEGASYERQVQNGNDERTGFERTLDSPLI